MKGAWHPVTLLVIWAVGRAARERLEREGRYEYVGCRRDCITISQSAISYCLAFGAAA
jgi:hypothetical protein